jgi:hypothetical protein
MFEKYKKLVQQTRITLKKRNTFSKNGREYALRALFPVEAWADETSTWLGNCERSEKDVFTIGNDSGGNYFLLRSGQVTYWDHETDLETPLSKTLEDFLAALWEGTPVKLNPGDVIKVWIDPDFLREQKKKGNA